MCLVDEENDSVLEISDDKVIFNPNMDFNNLNQHWYIYPYNQRDKTFTIVSRKEQNLLQLHDNNELIVKQCDSEGVAAGCTIDHGYFHTENKRFKVYPMVGSYFYNCQTWRRCVVWGDNVLYPLFLIFIEQNEFKWMFT